MIFVGIERRKRGQVCRCMMVVDLCVLTVRIRPGMLSYRTLWQSLVLELDVFLVVIPLLTFAIFLMFLTCDNRFLNDKHFVILYQSYY